MPLIATSVLVAAAVAFCAEQPDEPRCFATEVAPHSLTDTHRSTLARLASEAYISPRMFMDDAGDQWLVRTPRQRRDCEDADLWAAQQLRQLHPELQNSYRFVLVSDHLEASHAQPGRTLMHLVLVIEGTSERLVIDPQSRSLRLWSDYTSRRALTPIEGLGGRWTSYR